MSSRHVQQRARCGAPAMPAAAGRRRQEARYGARCRGVGAPRRVGHGGRRAAAQPPPKPLPTLRASNAHRSAARPARPGARPHTMRRPRPAPQHAPLGASDLVVPSVTIGTMTFGEQTDEAEAHRMLSMAADVGANFLDTAEVRGGGLSAPPPRMRRGPAAAGPARRRRRRRGRVGSRRDTGGTAVGAAPAPPDLVTRPDATPQPNPTQRTNTPDLPRRPAPRDRGREQRHHRPLAARPPAGRDPRRHQGRRPQLWPGVDPRQPHGPARPGGAARAGRAVGHSGGGGRAQAAGD